MSLNQCVLTTINEPGHKQGCANLQINQFHRKWSMAMVSGNDEVNIFKQTHSKRLAHAHKMYVDNTQRKHRFCSGFFQLKSTLSLRASSLRSHTRDLKISRRLVRDHGRDKCVTNDRLREWMLCAIMITRVLVENIGEKLKFMFTKWIEPV